MPPAKGSPQSWISQGMGSGALASFRLTWMHGRPQLGPDLRSKAGVRTAHSSPQEKLNEDFYEFLEDKIQENLPESLQESSPLLQEARQEVPRRIQRPSVSACLEVQNLDKSIWPEPCGGSKAFCRVSSRGVGMC